MALTCEEQARAFITDAMQTWLKHGGTYKQIAEEAGISVSTLKKLTEGDTTFPRFHTVEAVLGAFGRRIELLRTNVYKVPASSRNRQHAESSGRI